MMFAQLGAQVKKRHATRCGLPPHGRQPPEWHARQPTSRTGVLTRPQKPHLPGPSLRQLEAPTTQPSHNQSGTDARKLRRSRGRAKASDAIHGIFRKFWHKSLHNYHYGTKRNMVHPPPQSRTTAKRPCTENRGAKTSGADRNCHEPQEQLNATTPTKPAARRWHDGCAPPSVTWAKSPPQVGRDGQGTQAA